uniref:Uncharacterized protein n=1 Tax=Arundo donax TaxID=35708 RepID=A0A0A8YCG3_ARUDO
MYFALLFHDFYGLGLNVEPFSLKNYF